MNGRPTVRSSLGAVKPSSALVLTCVLFLAMTCKREEHNIGAGAGSSDVPNEVVLKAIALE